MTASTINGPRRRKIKAVMLSLIGLLALGLILRLSSVFVPLGFAFLIAYILEPIIDFMDQHHSRRPLTVSLVYVIFLVLFVGIGFLVVPSLIDQGRDLVGFVKHKGDQYGLTEEFWTPQQDSRTETEKEADGWWSSLFTNEVHEKNGSDEVASQDSPTGEDTQVDPPTENGSSFSNVIKQNMSMIKQRIPAFTAGVATSILNGATNIVGLFTQIVLALFYAFFIMLHFPTIQKKSVDWIPEKHRGEVDEVLDEVDDVVAGFFRGRLIVCVIAAVATSIGLWISGIQFWLLLGVAAGFLGIIPFIGVALTLTPALGIAIASDERLFAVVGVLLTFAFVQGIVEPFIGPFVISGKVRMHPVTVTVAFFAGGALFGLMGLLLAVPVCGILKILTQRYLLPTLQQVLRG